MTQEGRPVGGLRRASSPFSVSTHPARLTALTPVQALTLELDALLADARRQGPRVFDCFLEIATSRVAAEHARRVTAESRPWAA